MLRTTYIDVIAASFGHPCDGSFSLGRQHDLVLDKIVLIHHSIDVTSSDVAAGLKGKHTNEYSCYPDDGGNSVCMVAKWVEDDKLESQYTHSNVEWFIIPLQVPIQSWSVDTFGNVNALSMLTDILQRTLNTWGVKWMEIHYEVKLLRKEDSTMRKWQNSPSKMLPMIPGPSSTDRGFPVLNTGSPTVTPAYIKSRLHIKCMWQQSLIISWIIRVQCTLVDNSENWKQNISLKVQN